MNQAVSDFERAGVISGASAIPVDEFQPTTPIQEPAEVEEQSFEHQGLPIIEDTASSNDATVRVVCPENYNMLFRYKEDKDYLFEIHFDSSNALNSWVNVAKKNSINYQITINLKHAFFKPFTENKDFLES